MAGPPDFRQTIHPQQNKTTIDTKLYKAFLRLMKKLNDEDQEDCLYLPTLEARDAVNKLLVK